MSPVSAIEPEPPRAAPRAYLLLAGLFVAYVGVYLCRKNLSVAVPMLQQEWGLTKESVGLIASVSTLAYAAGKFLFGPITDWLGGRKSLLASMALVALCGALGAMAPSLGMLVLFYSLSRFFGAASWGAMIKMVPEWFGRTQIAFACGLLSLSFVFGGALATAFAGLVAKLTGDSWQAVLAWPSVVLAVLLVGCAAFLPKKPRAVVDAAGNAQAAPSPPAPRPPLLSLFRERRFIVLLALSFTLTLLREIFNFWAVDFIRTEAGSPLSNAVAALVSTPFDLCGAVGIVLMGWVFGRLDLARRQQLLVAILMTLSLVLLGLPFVFDQGLWMLALGIGAIGFLVYGPYSLLAGVLAVEVRGKESAATVAGLVDGTGYIAGFLSGILFGHLLTAGGYRLGFGFMAGLTAVSAVLCMFMYPRAQTVPVRVPRTPSAPVPNLP
jgi:sugar phosphate permease